MKPMPYQNISQLSSIDPDLDLYQWQRLADYSDSSFSDQSFLSEVDINQAKGAFSQHTTTILAVATTLLLLGSALWYHSVECNQSYSVLEETMEMEVKNAPRVDSLFN